MTPRQLAALDYAARDGLTVHEIAHRLGVSPATVKRDLDAVRHELDAPTTAVAYVRAHATPKRPRRHAEPEPIW